MFDKAEELVRDEAKEHDPDELELADDAEIYFSFSGSGAGMTGGRSYACLSDFNEPALLILAVLEAKSRSHVRALRSPCVFCRLVCGMRVCGIYHRERKNESIL